TLSTSRQFQPILQPFAEAPVAFQVISQDQYGPVFDPVMKDHLSFYTSCVGLRGFLPAFLPGQIAAPNNPELLIIWPQLHGTLERSIRTRQHGIDDEPVRFDDSKVWKLGQNRDEIVGCRSWPPFCQGKSCPIDASQDLVGINPQGGFAVNLCRLLVS